MKLTRPSEVKELLARLDLRPNKVLGQNFLIDGNILGIMVGAASLEPSDVVLEVGPGLGVLTEALAPAVRRVIAIEKDAKLCAYLRERLAGRPNVEIHHADILETDLAAILGSGVTKLISNLPYSVGSRVLVEVCMSAHLPAAMVVTVQREVADRLAAPPDTPDYGLLGILVQIPYEVRIVRNVSSGCFYPPPEVQSAIVLMTRRLAPRLRMEQPALFLSLVKFAFSRRRKQMKSLLPDWPPLRRAGPGAATKALSACGIDPLRRPETLSIEEWGRLFETLAIDARPTETANGTPPRRPQGGAGMP
jgi:16S rRNA (adenine1518-N6/adenine1519-N6)-dimethyltransferase